ncbi:TetR family transcriptional regulator [Marinomonas agarivorans]|nr:TetR family transcriptional regulator [Marinomonas agarivorans]
MSEIMSVNERVSVKKREAILNAAIAEFIEQGFQKASMDKISARADVSKRTVYKHFTSKENLFFEISKTIWSTALEATDYQYQSELPLKQQLTEIAIQELTLITSQYYLDASRMLMAEHMITPELGVEALEKTLTLESGFKRWLKSAVQDNKLNIEDYDLAVAQFLGLLKSATYWPQIVFRRPTPSEAQQQQVLTAAVRMFLSEYES